MNGQLALKEIQKICYELDKKHQRSWQVFVNDVLLSEVAPDAIAMPTPDMAIADPLILVNPRIRQLPFKEVTALVDLTDKLIIYEVRIIKHPALSKYIGKINEYKLSFNQGVSMQAYQLIEARESQMQGFAWHLLLAR